ncbi:hypothetical protein [Microcystis sp.]|uniref:Uncharacterized protein n=1 Tax=Bacteriophage sp. TaxID=38018 RepID=A0A7G9A4M2_9VIRU|nr:MAG: hypothetical protein [Bacteriophage sp.]
MPINNYEDYLSQISLQNAESFQSNITGATVARLMLISRFFPTGFSVPSSSIALDNTSLYGINNNLLGTSELLLLGGQFDSPGTGTLIVADLLNISGELSGIVTTEQTINLPTAPLTRYTNGEGVFAGLIIWTVIGNTIATVSINYTNQNGISEQISPLLSFPFSAATGDRNPGRIYLIPLAPGDTGVRAVKSLTLSASTGTAGNFGVILFKPLAMMAVSSSQPIDAVSTGGFTGSLCKIFPNACLSGFLCPSASTQTISGSLLFGR